MILHAGCLAVRVAGRWRGVLLRGPSGVGKSDLALRLLERGWALVADDRALLWSAGGRLYAKAPDSLAGLMEVRGVDVLTVPRRAFAPVDLLADCLPPEAELDRLPPPLTETVAGVQLVRTSFRPLEGSAPAKLERALGQALERGRL